MPQSLINANYFERLYCYIRAIFGHPEYQYKVAQLISQSELPNAKDNALRWYETASKNGHVDACFEYAVYTINHLKDEDLAIQILKKAPYKSSAKIESLLGQLLITKYTQVIDQRRFEVENKIKTAHGQDELDQYIQSLIPRQAKPKKSINADLNDDQLNSYLEEAKYHLLAAQELNHPLGFHALAIFYLEYCDSKELKNRGIKLLKQSVDMKFAPSCQVMAGIYENGLYGHKENISRGLELRVIAAEQGSKDAQFTLGYLVYYGQGFEQNRELGMRLIMKAADNGHIEAINLLSSLKKEVD